MQSTSLHLRLLTCNGRYIWPDDRPHVLLNLLPVLWMQWLIKNINGQHLDDPQDNNERDTTESHRKMLQSYEITH